jgi:hypothetical protein
MFTDKWNVHFPAPGWSWITPPSATRISRYQSSIAPGNNKTSLPTVHWLVYNSPPTVCIQSQMIPIHIQSYFSHTLILSSVLFLILRVVYNQVSIPKFWTHFTSCARYVLRPPHPPWCDHPNDISWTVHLPLICGFLQSPIISSPLITNIIQSTIFSNNLNLLSSLNARD